MVLVDTSVWVEHLRKGHPRLVELLNEGSVLGHPYVIGELSCGNIRNREDVLVLLRAIPHAELAEDEAERRSVGPTDPFKAAWARMLKTNPTLILVLCGSVWRAWMPPAVFGR